jgi:L-fucose dehydrogenase
MVAPKAHSLGHLIVDLQLKDRVVLVTRGAKTIGTASIETCAQGGAFTVAVDHDAQACQRLLAELNARALEAIFIAMDLLAAEHGQTVVEQTIAKCDRIDALVNNAGIKALHLLHYYRMAHYALPHLSKSRIVNISWKTAPVHTTAQHLLVDGGYVYLDRALT